MSRRVADGILRGLKQALAIANGTAKKGTYVVHIPHEIDVKRIRGKLGLTQQQFAARFDFSVNTLRHWEQGRRVPDGPSRAYLKVIDHEPEAVQKALRIATPRSASTAPVSLSSLRTSRKLGNSRGPGQPNRELAALTG